MGPIKTNKLGRILTSKGFETKENDHTYYFLYVGNKKTSIRTKISHGSKEYDGKLLSQMSRQLHFRNNEFNDFLDCTLTYDDYVQLMIERQHLKLC